MTRKLFTAEKKDPSIIFICDALQFENETKSICVILIKLFANTVKLKKMVCSKLIKVR